MEPERIQCSKDVVGSAGQFAWRVNVFDSQEPFAAGHT
jgi:hypothetical protein